jgi:hypothetical protein
MSRTAELSAPLDGVTEGHLVVRHGLGAATIGTDPQLAELVHGRWQGRRHPRARVHRGTVELTFPRLSLGLGSPAHELVLNGSVPWRIEIDGGAGDVEADLSGAAVQGVDVRGGMARTHVDLPAPDGTMVVRLGAVSDVVVTRPAGVPVRVRVRRGSRELTLDGQSYGAVGGPTTLVTPAYDTTPDRIDLVVDAADHLTIASRPRRP